jgi:DNA sulfur modification protein DndE
VLKTTLLIGAFGGGTLAMVLSAVAAAAQQPAARPDPEPSTIAAEAYIYGYPIVLMYVTKRVETNVAEAQSGKAPVNQLASLFKYPTAEFKDVVAPNVNTLQTSGWLDLSKEPMIIRVPDTSERYYVLEILDFWTNVIAAPGKRTTGTKAQEIALLGPSWRGKLPESVTQSYRSPTNNVWISNRIQANGVHHYATVNALQRGITITPLSKYGSANTLFTSTADASVDTETPPAKQVNTMSAEQYFATLARALGENPPAAVDAPMVRRLAQIGIVPGREFKPDRANAQALRQGAKEGLQKITQHSKTIGRIQNGWQTLANCGDYGTQYLTRAAVTMKGLGCSLAEDALNPTTTVDAEGKPLNGANNYVLHFPAGQTPPANAFWSVTMYDPDFFLVNNRLNRYALSSWNDLTTNPDGSLDIYVQRTSPGSDKESNWLPAPAGDFVLMTRLYWPKESAIKGTWSPPGVQRAQ